MMWGGGEGRSEGEEVMRMKPAIYKIQIPTIPSTIRIARAERALRSCLVILNIFLEPVFVEAREYFSHEGFVSEIRPWSVARKPHEELLALTADSVGEYGTQEF